MGRWVGGWLGGDNQALARADWGPLDPAAAIKQATCKSASHSHLTFSCVSLITSVSFLQAKCGTGGSSLGSASTAPLSTWSGALQSHIRFCPERVHSQHYCSQMSVVATDKRPLGPHLPSTSSSHTYILTSRTNLAAFSGLQPGNGARREAVQLLQRHSWPWRHTARLAVPTGRAA